MFRPYIPTGKPKISVEVVSLLPLTADCEKGTVLETLCQVDGAAPDFINGYEPINKPFNPTDLTAAIEIWHGCLLWKRKRSPKYGGGAWSDWLDRGEHGWVTADMPMGTDPRLAVELVKALSEHLLGDFAIVHLPCQAMEQELMTASNTGGNVVRVGPHIIHKYIPELYWLTVFGPPYVEHFGRERLLGAPAYRVEELPYGGICLQLSESPMDFLDGYSKVDQVRQSVKDHLDNDSFFRLDYWYKARGVSTLEEYYEKWQDLVLTGGSPPGEHQYNVPDFRVRERRRMISGY